MTRSLDELIHNINHANGLEGFDSEKAISRLIQALKKCREQRDVALEDYKYHYNAASEYEIADFKDEYDAEIAALLEGKS